MAGYNTTGRSRVRDLFIPRGCVLVAELQDGQPISHRELGNLSGFTLEASTEVIEHFTSKLTTRVKDLEIITELDASFEMEVEEFNHENLRTFFVGDLVEYANAGQQQNSASGDLIVRNPRWTGYAGLPLDEAALEGRSYELHYDGSKVNMGLANATDCHEQRIYQIAGATLVLRLSTVTLVGGTSDFTAGVGGFLLGESDGSLYVPYAGVGGSGLFDSLDAIAADAIGGGSHTTNLTGGALTVNDEFMIVEDVVQYNGTGTTATTLDEMRAFTSNQRLFQIKFLALNAADEGAFHEIVIHQAKLRPNGDVSLIAEDEFATLTLSGAIESNSDAQANSPYMSWRTVRV